MGYLKLYEMKLHLSLFTIALLITTLGFSQVPQKIVVEHFTNTRCSVCGSRNPGLFTNINNQNNPDILHLAVHPSSPYSTCVFSQHNKTENDARTGYYGLLGATPQITVNGEKHNGGFTTPTLFDSYTGKMSPLSIQLFQQKMADSMRVKVVVTVEASHSLGAQNLYLVLAEDTVFYNAPNGENQHYDVFRKALLGDVGTQINLPSTIGDSVVFVKTVANHSDWNMSRMFAMAIIQNVSDKKVNQVDALDASVNENIVLGIHNTVVEELNVSLYPNPVSNSFTMAVESDGVYEYQIQDLTGKTIEQGSFTDKKEVDARHFRAGIYLVTLKNDEVSFTQKFVKVTP